MAGQADAEAGAEDEADEVVVFFHAAGLAEPLVDVWQGAGQCLAVGEEVGVVVDEDGQPELTLQEGAEGDAALEGGEVGEAGGEDAVGIVGGAGEGPLPFLS